MCLMTSLVTTQFTSEYNYDQLFRRNLVLLCVWVGVGVWVCVGVWCVHCIRAVSRILNQGGRIGEMKNVGGAKLSELYAY